MSRLHGSVVSPALALGLLAASAQAQCENPTAYTMPGAPSSPQGLSHFNTRHLPAADARRVHSQAPRRSRAGGLSCRLGASSRL